MPGFDNVGEFLATYGEPLRGVTYAAIRYRKCLTNQTSLKLQDYFGHFARLIEKIAARVLSVAAQFPHNFLSRYLESMPKILTLAG